MKKIVALLLVICLLLCACGVTAPPETTAPETTVPDTTALQTPQVQWTLTGDWQVEEEQLTAPGQENAMAVNEMLVLGDGWTVEVGILPDACNTRLLLCDDSGDVEAAVALNMKGRKAQLSVEELKYGAWKTLTEGTERISYDKDVPLELQVLRYGDRDYLQIRLYQNGEEISSLKSTDVTVRTLSKISKVGLGADGAAVFSGLQVNVAQRPESPMETLLKTKSPEEAGFYRAIAEQAVADMVGNFWTGDTETGKILPTWGGFATQHDWRGSTWETALVVFGIYDMWRITGDSYYYDLLTAEAKFFRENFSEQELEAAGELFMWANDDTGWNAMMLLAFYSVTGDMWFVDRVIGLLDNANKRWYDEELGGLRYKDEVDYMALCEVAITWSWLRLWEITGQQRFYDLSMESYSRLHDRLGREDGLYFMQANAYFHDGEASRIEEAGSSSFLGGNMCMAALSAKFYRITGEQKYLDRVYRTNEGLLQYYDNDGVLLNDRDAWCNATFTAFYVSEVLILPDTEEMQELIYNTALSVVINARTDDGYYGGSWSGPAEGSGSVWYVAGSVPQMSMTTGNTVLMVTAAAMLEAGMSEYTR